MSVVREKGVSSFTGVRDGCSCSVLQNKFVRDNLDGRFHGVHLPEAILLRELMPMDDRARLLMVVGRHLLYDEKAGRNRLAGRHDASSSAAFTTRIRSPTVRIASNTLSSIRCADIRGAAMPDGVEIAYKAGVILILGLFLCLTAWSYLHHQLKGEKRVRADYIKDKLGATTGHTLLDMEWAGGPRGQDYWVPVGSAVLVTIFGVFSCLFANELLSIQKFFNLKPDLSLHQWNSILLTGLFQGEEKDALHMRRWQSLTVMSLAFLGTFIWSAHNIIRRYINYDLMPVEYYHTTLRLILAPLLALMLSFLVSTGAADWSTNVLPVAAFMTGLIPAAVLFFLQDWFVRILKSYGFHTHHLPLSMIEGLNRFHEVRLSEAGIDNAQNLANADLVEIGLATPFPLEQLLDWIDQALLYVHLRDSLAVARDHRVRTASDLIVLDAEDLKRLEGVEGLSDLTMIARLAGSDPIQTRVSGWRQTLAAAAKTDTDSG